MIPNVLIADPRFLACLPLTLAQEAPDSTNWSDPRNFSNDPSDPGGATMEGITQAEFTRDCHKYGWPLVPVIQITQEQGYFIYYNNYWLPYCPKLPPGLDLCEFDTDVNQGPGEGVRILQTALGVASDGVWGPITQSAVAAITNVPSVIEAFTSRREQVYEQTRNFPRFGTDWMRRAEEIGTAAARAGVMKKYALALHARYMLLGKET
jgi:lysozyme family protein